MSATHDPHGDDHGGGHGHGHGSRFIQHHYDDAQHQFDSGKFGIWLFLAQEVLFFSALFVAYVLYRHHHPEIYSYAHKWLDVKYGAINTAVLIFSSLTAAWAVRCAQLKQRAGLILCIATTLACACTFLGIKYIEYSHKYHEHILFGRYFDPCVSPGEVPLLTKNNECKGTKSTIEWDYGANQATTGCFEEAKIDLDPAEPGVQADCVVKEYEGEDLKKLAFKRDITNRCPSPFAALDREEAGESAAQAEAHETPAKYPCWRVAEQPAVCPDKTTGEQHTRGIASNPQAGIIVEYGDREERGEDVHIKAECKAPPPATPAAPGATPPSASTPAFGKQLVSKPRVRTAHIEHERESKGAPPEHTNMFLSVYFAMTGLHGVHVLVGVIVFIWLLIRAIKGHFTPDYFGPIDYAALYWHIVDLIWIFLFPLLYLIH